MVDGPEDGIPAAVHEDAEERGVAVVGVEAAEEGRVGDEAAPLLAGEGGAREGGGLGREADEDLREEVIVLRQEDPRRRRGGSAATPPARAGAGAGAAAPAGHIAVLLLTSLVQIGVD
uniref:DUF834 domain-containing protein n=1 Tax=Leersia perrieri TaxID=77586 RepID=A0A0D9X0D0_9ORYZ